MAYSNYRTIFFTFTFLISQSVISQTYIISGKVVDAKTQQQMEFVNIYLKSGHMGGLTDEAGKFSVQTKLFPDTLIISFIGYKTKKMFIVELPKEKLLIKLEEDADLLSEVTVTSYKDPGKHIMQEVIANRSKNDINQFDNSVFNEYRKTEIDICNINTKKDNGFFGNIASIYNKFGNDSSGSAAPIFFTEKFFRTYHSKKLQTNVEHQIAMKQLGLSTDKLASPLEKFDIRINIYNPIIPILKTSFLSPVSELGLFYYKFIPLDTITDGGKKYIKLEIKPKVKNENTFTGYLWVEDETYAITKVDIKISKGSNINFINQLDFKQDFVSIGNQDNSKQSYWIPKTVRTTIEFSNGLDLIGIPIKADTASKKMKLISSSAFSNYIINSEDLNSNNFYNTISSSDSNGVKTNTIDEFNDSYRTEKLSVKEQAIYKAIDSLKKNKKFIIETKLTSLFATGYWDFGCKIRIGPFSSLLSTNQIEGVRSRLSFWTLPCISKNINLNGYIAYGTKDKVVKGGLGIKFVPSIGRYCKTELLARSDFDVMLDFDDVLDEDNLFTLALRKNIPAYKVFIRQLKLLQEVDLNHNWSAKLIGNIKTMNPNFNYMYYKTLDEQIVDYTPLKKLSVTEVGLTLRYAHNERTTIFNYDKIRIFSLYPVFSLNYLYGFDVGKNNYFEYQKITASLIQELNLPIKGSIFYYASAGQLIGTVPALLLFAPKGNAYYVSNKYTFNNMLPYEFAADRFASLMIRYNMGGIILDKIPLINKLKLRERVIFNNYWGSIHTKNLDFNNINPIKTTGNIPYSEAGFGIGNIFKIMSFDAIWRLTQLNSAKPLTRFGIYTTFTIVF
ncbi:MAG: DUF5686 family protein [Bacteroidia bacterium]